MALWEIIIVGIGVLVLVVFGIAVISWSRGFDKKANEQSRLKNELWNNGIQSEAMIIKTEYLGFNLNSEGKSAFKLELEITPKDGSMPYIVDQNMIHRFGFFLINPSFADRLKKQGAIIPVLIHPSDPKVVGLDHERIYDSI